MTIGSIVSLYLFQTRRLPAPVLRAFDNLVALDPRDVARNVLDVLRSYPTLVFGIVAICVWMPSVPGVDALPSFAAGVYRAVVMIGIIWLAVMGGQLLLVGVVNDSDPWQASVSVAWPTCPSA